MDFGRRASKGRADDSSQSGLPVPHAGDKRLPVILPRFARSPGHGPPASSADVRSRIAGIRARSLHPDEERPRPDAGRTPLLLHRRRVLQLAGALAAIATLPLTRAQRALATAQGRFLTTAEIATLEALCDRIVPPDHDPGAAALGAARYIDQLLSAFERVRIPFIYAGGPFSGRNPYPDTRTGTPSARRPRNGFATPIPLSRLQELRWRAELYGSAAVPEAAMNDAALGPLRGLRDVYRDSLARVDEVARAAFDRSFAQLRSGEQDEVFAMLDQVFEPVPRRDASFLDILIQHTLEGCFAAPEYGGNADAGGWRMIGIEGDTHPLGFSVYSRNERRYKERADHPMSTPNPDEIAADGTLAPRPIGADAQKIQASIMTLSSSLGDGC
jgi:hypothetical protein